MTELNQSSEMSETTPAQPAEEKSAREKLAAALGDESPGDAGESQQNAQAEAGKPKGKPKVFNDLAERLELTPEDLYAIEVPMADGKTLPIGKLKDAAAKQGDLMTRELAFAERVSKQEAEWTRSQTEFAELMAQLDPKAIKPEVTAKIREKIAASHKLERELTLKAIPEWQNETVRDAELVGMVEHLKDYGIPENYLLTSMSHKLFRFVRDAYLRKTRVEKALAHVETVRKPSTTGKSGAGNGAARKPANASKTAPRTARDRLNQLLS